MLTDQSIPLNEIPSRSWNDLRLKVRPSSMHGKGLFATAPIQQGEVVIIWGGTLFTLEDIRAGKADEHSYAAIREGIFLGHPYEQGNNADDFMNHSCDPNIWMINEITWVARRNISTGEEVTAVYVMYWGCDGDERVKWECRCGSSLCRKVFTTDDWQRADLQERYGDHFAPYIQEDIRQLREGQLNSNAA